MVGASNRRGLSTGARLAVIVAAVVVVVAVVVFVVNRQAGPAADCAPSAAPVRGLIGSEKEPYFGDRRVLDRLSCLGLAVTVEGLGSRDMLTVLNGGDYGFAFPSSTPTAEKIERERGVNEDFAPFESPMTVATFAPVVETLRAAGIVHPGPDGIDVVDMRKLIDTSLAGTRWDELPGDGPFTQHQPVLLRTTDPQDSNSAIMFLAIASNVLNGEVVGTPAEADAVLPGLCRLFVAQGEKPTTSQVLFDYYRLNGIGRVPMGLIYEAQFAAKSQPALSPDRVVLFPAPTVYSRHTVVPLADLGRQVGQALERDPVLLELATEYGFRPVRPGDAPISDRPVPQEVVEPPSFEILERMLAALRPAEGTGEPCAGVTR